jgi:UrcA family protein
MHTQSASTRTLLAMVIAGSLFAGMAQAKDYRVIVSKPVSTAGLDLGKPADAQRLYMRLRWAATDVCTRSLHVDLLRLDDPRDCFEKALGNAVRQVHAPLVTQAYLGNHTLRDMATWGIELPAEVARR